MSLMPSAPLLIVTKPVMPNCLRAFFSADCHLLRLVFFFDAANLFLETTLPLLFRHRSALVSPPLVYVLVPFHTLRYDPVIIFLVTFLTFLALLTFDALGALAFLATRLVAFGAFGFDARRALRAARRVARRFAARFGALAFFAARRVVALAAIVIGL